MLIDNQIPVRTLCAVFLAVLTCSPSGAQHVHGRVELDIVSEGGTLAMSVRTPLADLVGFEHEPENDGQVERLRQAAALLADPARMFAIPESAGCVALSTAIDAPDFLQELLDSQAHDEENEAHGHDEHDEDGATDAHDHHADHDDHSDEDSHEHADAHAQYEWECTDSAMLVSIEPSFVREFENVDKLVVQIVTPDGAQYLEVGGEIESIPISAP